MGCEPELRAAIGEALGESVAAVTALGGGTGGQTYRVVLSSGRRVFVKAARDAPADFFSAEAAGLAWLAASATVRTPEVLAVRTAAPAFIAMELIDAGAPIPAFDEVLGRSLAALHRDHPDRFGLDHDNYVGALPQPNATASQDSWAAFYAERRLLPLAQRLHDRGLLDARTAADLEAIAAALPDRIPVEPPARLHGDLWGGNLVVGQDGAPVLIDPAVYGGHREIDLAMMQLFGGFSARVFAAYDEAYPLQPGWRARTPLLQLYPLLVHVALFGRGYAGQLAAAAAGVR